MPQAQQLLGQVLGILATGITALSYQMNTKRSLLLVQTAATACTCLAYLLLGAASGFALNVVCIIRNVVFYFQKNSGKGHMLPAVLLSAVMVALGILSWQGPVSLLIMAALAANTLFLSLGDPQLLRKSILGTSSLVLLYNIFVFSLGGIANESLAIISSMVGIVRFRHDCQKSA